MPERDQDICAFLAEHGWNPEARAPLAGDASFRRYDRLAAGARRAVLMDAPPPAEDVRPFVTIARHLRALGFSAPEILAEAPGQGLLLIEDLGDATYTRVLAEAPAASARETERDLYRLAVDVLIALHRIPPAEVLPAGLPPYDETRLLDEALLLTDWYLPVMLERKTPEDVRDDYIAAWRDCLTPALADAPTLVLRDYHVDNLMWLTGRDGVAACGLLDFQDAVAGPRAYDLMSLLEDARRDIDTALTADMLARYRAAFPDLEAPGPGRDAFDTVYAVLAAQRHAKVIGIFTRLCRRDAKADYLVHIPRVWRLLERNLADPALAPVRDWFERHVAPDRRGIPEMTKGTA